MREEFVHFPFSGLSGNLLFGALRQPVAQGLAQKQVGGMRRFGLTIPMLVAEDGTISPGHGRLLAVQCLGVGSSLRPAPG